MMGIYKITNPEGLSYIGQSVNLEQRLRKHTYANEPQCKKLYASFMKYGVDAHRFEIIQECELVMLAILEQFYVELYDTIENGLNQSTNFHGRGFMNEETKRKISESNKGKIVSNETRAKISETLMGNIPWNKGAKGLTTAWNKGIPSSDTTKKKLHDHWIGKTGNEACSGKYVYQFDLEGNVLAIWVNAREVTRQLGFNFYSINRAARGERKRAFGFKWCYANRYK